MKRKEYYCGGDYFPLWIRKVLSFSLNCSCQKHDQLYDDKTISKFFADYYFLYLMIAESLLNILRGILGLFLFPWYFISVLFFGRKSWREADKKGKIKNE